MKLRELFEKVNIAKDSTIVRDDLIMIMNALNVHSGVTENCFVTCVVEAIKIMTGVEVDTYNLDRTAKQHATIQQRRYDQVHPDDVVKSVKHIRGKDSERYHKIKLSYKMVTSLDEMKSYIKKGIPVIASMVWNDLLKLQYLVIDDHGDDFDDEKLRNNLGASSSFIKNLKHQRIIKYPTDDMIKYCDVGNIGRHAVNCVGYDAQTKTFICRDHSVQKHNGFFKVEESIFFDKKLESKKLSMVDAALIVEVEDIK